MPRTDADGGSPPAPTTETYPPQPSGDPERVVAEEPPAEEGAHGAPQTETDGGSPPASMTETYPVRPHEDSERVDTEGSPPKEGVYGASQADDGDDSGSTLPETHPSPSNEDPERP